MEHRPIIGAAKTGTISRSKARGAARFAKTVKRSSFGGSDGHQRSSYFKYLFDPATAEPENPVDGQGNSAKKSAKRSVRKTARKSARKSSAATSIKPAGKNHR
jgi:hypothetical protein